MYDRSHTFNDSMSFLNSSSYILARVVGDMFSCKVKGIDFILSLRFIASRLCGLCGGSTSGHLLASLDDFVVDVGDDDGVNDTDAKHLGQDPLQDVEPDIGTAGRLLFSILYVLRCWQCTQNGTSALIPAIMQTT